MGSHAHQDLMRRLFQLPPAPASASLLAPQDNPSYAQQQGTQLMDIEHVIDFVQMQRFTDPLLVEVLEAMRTPGGKCISEEAWQAITSKKSAVLLNQMRDCKTRETGMSVHMSGALYRTPCTLTRSSMPKPMENFFIIFRPLIFPRFASTRGTSMICAASPI